MTEKSVIVDKREKTVTLDIEIFNQMLDAVKANEKTENEAVNQYCCLICSGESPIQQGNVEASTYTDALAICRDMSDNRGGTKYTCKESRCEDFNFDIARRFCSPSGE
ncbi:hypothetical protein CKQ69_09175 [Bacillus toyonensis]|nr:hypothetical protein CKQ69_09175 [Bacillus toyonensis]